MKLKRAVLYALLGIIMVSLGISCRSMYDREGLDPISDLERAVSHDGTVLYAVNAGKPGAMCMFSSTYNSQYYHHKDAKLLTDRGAISVSQLKSALRFMGYGEHLITTAVFAVGTAAGVVASAGVIRAMFSTGGGAKPTISAVVAITGLVGGTFGYRIFKGAVEGEKYEVITVRSILDTLSFTLLSPLNEYLHRRSRMEIVISDKKEITFTDRRMKKLLEKLAETNPKFPGGCDHLKVKREVTPLEAGQ